MVAVRVRSPSKSEAVTRLRQIRHEHANHGRNEEALAVEKDLRLIERAPGEDLYTMARDAQDTAFRLERSLLYKDATHYFPAGPISMGLGVGGVAVGGALGWALAGLLKVDPTWLAVPLGLVGSSAMFLPFMTQSRAERAREVVEAVDRRYLEVQQ